MSAIRAQIEAALRDRYRIVSEIDRGGMAWVFRAEDLKHRRTVAIKVLRPEIGAVLGPERFEREIGIAARLNHPHIVPLFDSGRAGDHLYYVMPFVEGESLRERLERASPVPLGEALRITRDVASGLAYAHLHGVVHRDIKPENILLVGGSALVADFGIALPTDLASQRMTATGIAIGTLAYMSPEQATGGRDLDRRADLYSLGCVLYEMLTGTTPHADASPQELLVRRLAGPPVELVTRTLPIPPAVADVLARALATDREHRLATADALVALLDEAGAAAGPTRIRGPRRLALPLLGVGALVIAGVLMSRSSWAPAPGSNRAGRELASVAVLPFANLSADPADEYFGDGLGEDLINTLSRVPGLRVAPRTSAWAFKGKNLDLRAIAESLGVGAAVEGSVRSSSGVLRVTARLVRASDGGNLWTGDFDQRSRDDIFAIQDSIAFAIAGAIRRELAPTRVFDSVLTAGDGDPTPPLFRTPSAEAQDLYYRARYDWNRRTRPAVLRAIELFRQAVAKDSGYAAAWAGLADGYVVAAFYGYLPPIEAMPEARRAAQRALALEPRAGEVHSTLGYIAFWYDWDFVTAEAEVRRALELSPAYVPAHQFLANFLTAAGRFGEARDHYAQARSLDPLSLIVNAGQGYTEYVAGRPGRAAAIEREVIARDSSFVLAHYWLGLSLVSLGEVREAIAAFRRAAALTSDWGLALTGLAQAFAKAGQLDSALAMARALERRARREYVPALEMAIVYVALGDTEQAVDWLHRAARERSLSIALALTDPRLVPLQNHPEFKKVVGLIRR